MSFTSFLSSYLNLNLLIIVGFCSLLIFDFTLAKLKKTDSSEDALRRHNWMIVLVFVFGCLHVVIPQSDFFQPAVKVWSAQSLQTFASDYEATEGRVFLGLPSGSESSSLKATFGDVIEVTGVLFFSLIAIGFFLLGRDLIRLHRISRRSFLLRKTGRVRVFASEEVRVPFSYWLPWCACVVMPSGLIERPLDYKIALAHELQHHRRGDTQWIFVLWGLRLICVFNPAIHFWSRWIMEIQEFACDEALIGQRRFKSQAYARCLIEVAQTAIEQKGAPVCATGLTFLNERNLLKRRIERMFLISKESNHRVPSKSYGYMAMVLVAVLMAVTAYGSKGLVQDRRVSLTQARAMVAVAQSAQANPSGSSFQAIPIVVNDLVLKQLNRYIGTPEGREFMRQALARLANHRHMVSEALEKYQVPMEILALPIIESGYRNFAQGEISQTNKSAGIWQFIPQTARNYGLRVDIQKDERLDTALLTDAAMRYLQANNLRFKDWQLSLMAFNMGENAVQRAMIDLDTRDAWTLIRNGREGDKDYLAKFMAAVLIMRNPDSVQ